MIGANGNVRGKKEFEPSSQAAESEPLLGPHLEDYWPMEDYRRKCQNRGPRQIVVLSLTVNQYGRRGAIIFYYIQLLLP